MSRICIDFDDVLSATAVSLAALAEREFGHRIAYSEIRDFNLQNVFGFSDAEMTKFMAVAHTPEALSAYEVISGAAEGMNALRAAGHSVDIVTGRPAASHVASEAWLRTAGIEGFPVIYVDKYNRYNDYPHGYDDPVTISRDDFLAHPYDIAVDDSAQILSALANWTNSRVMIFDRPWNEAFRLAPNMTRVKSWPEIVRLVEVFG